MSIPTFKKEVSLHSFKPEPDWRCRNGQIFLRNSELTETLYLLFHYVGQLNEFLFFSPEHSVYFLVVFQLWLLIAGVLPLRHLNFLIQVAYFVLLRFQYHVSYQRVGLSQYLVLPDQHLTQSAQRFNRALKEAHWNCWKLTSFQCILVLSLVWIRIWVDFLKILSMFDFLQRRRQPFIGRFVNFGLAFILNGLVHLFILTAWVLPRPLVVLLWWVHFPLWALWIEIDLVNKTLQTDFTDVLLLLGLLFHRLWWDLVLVGRVPSIGYIVVFFLLSLSSKQNVVGNVREKLLQLLGKRKPVPLFREVWIGLLSYFFLFLRFSLDIGRQSEFRLKITLLPFWTDRAGNNFKNLNFSVCENHTC